ncbi:hypothetical protein Tco_1360793 [Tanacetum coccineum]
MFEFKQTNQFADAVFSIMGIVDKYLTSKMKDAVDVVVQLQTNKLREEAQAENHEFLNQVDSTIKAIIKEQVQAQVSKIMPKIEKYVTESLGAEVLVRSTNQPWTSYAIAASLSEFKLKKILIDKIETNKSIDRSDVQKDLYKALVESYNSDKNIISSYGDVVTLKRSRDDQDKDEDPSAGSNRGSKRRRSGKEAESSKEPTHKESKSTSSSKGATKSQPKSSGKSAHAEDHGQKVDDLEDQSHQEFNTGNDDETSKREALDDDESQHVKECSGLKYHLEEVFKAINDRLDWHNPEGKPYPHDLSKPLLLILNERGRQVIPLDHFINNDLEYLKGGSSIVYDKHAYWGTYHWGPKRQKFYGYATNMESSKDVYSRHMIITVTCLKIMQFFWYSHLEEIIVRRQDDQLYKFREGDFKRLRRQDIEDMLLLLVQGKLTNLNLEERYALNVALRMFTRQIVIQERMEDLQLGIKSYQKKINLTKPNTYRLDLKRMTPYTAYPDIQGIIYEDEMNKNRLLRTDELHKFSDGTLNHVRIALNDIATWIEMDSSEIED